MGANWVTVARKGPGAMLRPSSSATTAVSTMERPRPPLSSGTASAGQSRATMDAHSFSAGSPVSTTARTTSGGHSFSQSERASVSDVRVRLLCYLHAAPSPKRNGGSPSGGSPVRGASPGRRCRGLFSRCRVCLRGRQSGSYRSPTLSPAPLAQRQSNGLLIRRFRVQIPGGAPKLPVQNQSLSELGASSLMGAEYTPDTPFDALNRYP